MNICYKNNLKSPSYEKVLCQMIDRKYTKFDQVMKDLCITSSPSSMKILTRAFVAIMTQFSYIKSVLNSIDENIICDLFIHSHRCAKPIQWHALWNIFWHRRISRNSFSIWILFYNLIISFGGFIYWRFAKKGTTRSETEVNWHKSYTESGDM